MLKRALLSALIATAGPVVAQTCTPREYAQYKDDMATPGGRIAVAFSYCQHRIMRGANPNGSRAFMGCDVEMGKAMDALKTAADPAAMQFALRGCQGELPPLK